MDVPKAGIDGTLFSRGAGHTINHVSNNEAKSNVQLRT